MGPGNAIARPPSPGVTSSSACPTPNLGSGAHAAGVSEAKGGPALGTLLQHPFGPCPSERESLGRGVTKERVR